MKINLSQHAEHHLILGITVILSVGVIGYLANQEPHSDLQDKSVKVNWNELNHQSPAEFLKRKHVFKKELEKQFRQTGYQKASTGVRNAILYLFPELLPDGDFEKPVANEQWIPHQRAIEKNPSSLSSREYFRQMEANIWNYESADRKEISVEAAQVIRIYDQLTSQGKERGLK